MCLYLVATMAASAALLFSAPSSSASSVAAAANGAIRGRVDIRRTATGIERRPGVADLGTPPGRLIPDLRRSVVYLDRRRAARSSRMRAGAR